MTLSRTILILDRTPAARQRPSHDSGATPQGTGDDDDNFELEPCTMWMSFMDAALHYTRLSLELAPISIHAAPGITPTGHSVILNTWTPDEQTLDHVASQLQVLRQATAATAAAAIGLEDTIMTEEGQQDKSTKWIEQALQGAIAHILEPIPSASVPTAPTAATTTASQKVVGPPAPAPTTALLGAVVNIVVVLADEDDHEASKSRRDSNNSTMKGRDDGFEAWSYGESDLRKTLFSALHSLRDSIRNSRQEKYWVSNIHVDFIRISSNQDIARADVIREDISRLCTASLYTVKTVNDTSATSALVNHFLRRNKDVQILRVHNAPLKSRTRELPIDLLYRTNHIETLVTKRGSEKGKTKGIQHNTLQVACAMVTELQYGAPSSEATRLLPSKCFHPASISPSSLTVSFYTAIANGEFHLLNESDSSRIASMVLLDRDGQLYVHCLDKKEEPQDFVHFSSSQGSSDVSQAHLEDFVNMIVRPNEISTRHDTFSQEGNKLMTIVPSALKSKSKIPDEECVDADGASSSSVNMALVNTTSRLDIQTRWMVQWEGERLHPILPAHDRQIQIFKGAICKSLMESGDQSVIRDVLDALLSDARPLALPGEHNPLSTAGKMNQQHQRVRECAQAVLADLWMIGQRFKSVSNGHMEAAKLIAGKVTPKGLDHQTVKRTLIPPRQRAAMLQQAEIASPASSPSIGGGSNMNDGGGGFGRGRGGARGGFSQRGGAGGPGALGRGGRGGFRGGHNSGSGSIGGNSPNPGDGGANQEGVMGGVSTSGPENDIMLSMTGKTQPVPYLITNPPTRDEIEDAEQEYLSQLGEDGCLLKAYWGSRGAQGSSLAVVLNSVHSLDTPCATFDPRQQQQPQHQQHQQQQPLPYHLQRPGGPQHKENIKRLRLQDFAGRTPVVENGGYSGNQNYGGGGNINANSRSVEM
ncbi:hypothetical protein BGZ83_006947 [Gryganskiella cystojenkinii]|nr:hypothetical protein BGZ83_006947 [Gryganskiella cystojenkinii]